MDFKDIENNEKEEIKEKTNNDEKPRFPIPEWIPVRDVDDGDWDF